MKIVIDNPPNISAIKLVFPLSGKEIFAWGDIIYNPGNVQIPAWLVEHEMIHQKQQGDDTVGWWNRYLVDPQWRIEQELEAHRREYKVFCLHNKDRNVQARYLNSIASRLSSALYGNVVSKLEALRKIK
jgi:hypothetical protein